MATIQSQYEKMTDLIDRQAAINAVGLTTWAGSRISRLHAIDAVPVVRCKDCKHYEETDSRIGTCLLTVSGAEVDGFCSWGERREDNV